MNYSYAGYPCLGLAEGCCGAQVLDFQRLLGFGRTLDTNARPTQALHGRAFDYETVEGTLAAEA